MSVYIEYLDHAGIFNKQQQKTLKETLEKCKKETLCDSLEITHHHQIAQMVLRNTGVFLDNKEKHILAYLSTFAKIDGSNICVSYTKINKRPLHNAPILEIWYNQ